MSSIQRVGIVVFCVLLSGCQNAPTKSYDAQPVVAKSEAASILPVVTDQTVVIDARPPFEFALAHLNGSVNLRWEDFSQRTRPFRGLLELDSFSLARRFANYGIAPNTPVIVVGRGLRGEGEEGRLAWTLKVLGVKNVRFAGINAFSLPKSLDEAPPRKSETIWKPELDSNLSVERGIFVQKVMKKKTNGDTTVVIDVRSEAEYLGKDLNSPYAHSAPDIGSFNIPWTEFFDSKGLVNQKISKRLQEVGISKTQEIFVIDNMGVRSAAVTLALREMGFVKSSNFAGGYMELIESK